MTWTLYYTKQTQKGARKLASSSLKDKPKELLNIIQENPYQNPPPYKKLIGDLSGVYSRRINIQYRLVYQVLDEKRLSKLNSFGLTMSKGYSKSKHSELVK